jgi:hypothetical protein
VAFIFYRRAKKGLAAWRTRKPAPGRTRVGNREMVDATVDELLATVNGLLKDETDRATSLNTRASGLTGFIGIILSVAAAAGAATSSTTGAALDHWVRVLVGICLVLALGLLVAALILVIAKVLLPTEGFTISMEQVRQYPNWKSISRERALVQGEILRNFVRTLERDRLRNAGKARWLGRSYKLVGAGLILVALSGGAATLDRYVGGAGGREDRHHREQGHRGASRVDYGREPIRRSGARNNL